mmetsp:Transcript_17769/g.50082  ORF Transcript_17769/g.50082 Transcript_17769/m.50082 type:complete len:420 (+) Transcript_17769:3-1262(+)
MAQAIALRMRNESPIPTLPLAMSLRGRATLMAAMLAGARAWVDDFDESLTSMLQVHVPKSPKPPQADPAVAAVMRLNKDLWFQMPQEERDPKCIDKQYDTSKMEALAVVIPYLQENVTLMQRLVGSLVANTPEHLLDEILFVDDANPANTSYKELLEGLHPKVRVHRNAERQGLTKAKVTGAENTKAPVIVFMEPHCIANKQWAEPLLERLAAEPKLVAVPVIDALKESNTNVYWYLENPWGGFNWDMNFKWPGKISERNHSWRSPDPFPTPALSGGILALRREWWEESGQYDAGMREWGGENVEMSLRMWRCGGSIEIVPCSRIGHMFRKSRPYTFHGEVARVNELRLALVWMPEYLPVIWKTDKILGNYVAEAGDLAERVALRDRLQCKSMDWYMDNVYPELRKDMKQYKTDMKEYS